MLSDGLSKNTYSDKQRAKPPFVCKNVNIIWDSVNKIQQPCKLLSLCKYSSQETTTKGTDINRLKNFVDYINKCIPHKTLAEFQSCRSRLPKQLGHLPM
jgi:hypothetical protein